MGTRIRPLGWRVLVEVQGVKEEKSAGGLVLPATAQNASHPIAKVLVLGDGVDAEGKKHDFRVKVGDTVMIDQYARGKVDVKDQRYIITEEKFVLAIFEDE